MIRSCFVVCLLTLVLVLSPTPAAAVYRPSCQQLAVADPTLDMIVSGCTQWADGTWHAAPGRCAKIARQLTRRGFRAAKLQVIARQNYSCAINPFGVWEGFSWTM